VREGAKRKIWWKNRLAVGGWLRRKGGDMKEVYMGFADTGMGRHWEAPGGGGGAQIKELLMWI